MRVILLLVLMSCGFFSLLTGCEQQQENNNEELAPPATLVKVAGSEFNQVVLSKDAANRIGIELVALQEVPTQLTNANTPNTAAVTTTAAQPQLTAQQQPAAQPQPMAQSQPQPLSQQQQQQQQQPKKASPPQPATQTVMAKQVPYSAIIYGTHGETWVYTLVKPLTYMRAPVTIDHINDNVVILSSGPATSTQIVSVGASELYGVEYIGNIEP